MRLDWQKHALPNVPQLDRMAVVEPAEPVLARDREALKRDDVACFGSVDDALVTTDAGLVLITTPMATHVPVAIQAIVAGRQRLGRV